MKIFNIKTLITLGLTSLAFLGLVENATIKNAANSGAYRKGKKIDCTKDSTCRKLIPRLDKCYTSITAVDGYCVTNEEFLELSKK